MGVLVDSSILIAAERRRVSLKQVLAERVIPADEKIHLSAISATELLHGVYRAAGPRQRAKREAFVEHALGQFPILPVDLFVARLHARLWAELEKKGTRVGVHDLLIAATALAYDCAVVTDNQRDLRKVPGLQLK